MDMSYGDWSSHLQGMEDQGTTLIHESQMIRSSQNEENGFNNNHFDPTGNLFLNNSNSGLNQNNININNSNDGHFHSFSSSTINDGRLEFDMPHNASTTGGWSSCPWSSNYPSASEQLLSFGSSQQLLFDANYNTTTIDVPHQPNNDDNQDHCIINCPDNYDHEDDDRAMSYTDVTSYNLSHQKQRSTRVGSGTCSQQHVLAERKRREIMTHRFLALSALIPGLNKTDKASILGDAAKYLKKLKERVKVLEEQTTQKSVECAVLMNTRRNPYSDDIISCSSYDDHDLNHPTNPLLEIEARASSNKNVLIRIHSLKDQGLVQKVLNEIDKLHLTTLNCSTMPFGSCAMNITIIAQMNDDLCMTVNDLVRRLRLALQHF